MHSGQLYRAGWIVALGRWYKLRQRSERGYELLPTEVLLVVNHMIFLKDLTFTGSQSGPQGRALRQTATGPYGAQRAKGPGLSFFSEDSHNFVLDAQGLDSGSG
eukprot:2360837-Prymnesium_polylepis.1